MRLTAHTGKDKKRIHYNNNATMRKLKLYLDTSVISHIDAPHKPVEEAATRKFFQYVKEHDDEYELLISPMVDAEIRNCPEPKRSMLLELLQDLIGTWLPEASNTQELVKIYLEQGVLGSQHWRDLTHLAYATVSDCDYILSWNFKHFVNVHTVHRVNTVNVANNYRLVTIVAPPFITGENLYAEV